MNILTTQLRAAFEATAQGTHELTKDKDGQYRSSTTQIAFKSFADGARWMSGLNSELGRSTAPETPLCHGDKEDPQYQAAVDLVCTMQRASVSLVQRHLRISYNRAESLLKAMEGTVLTAPNEMDCRELMPAYAARSSTATSR